MNSHRFLFTPGIWKGTGTITLSVSPTQLHFTTQWTVLPIQASGYIDAIHVVEIQEAEEPVKNSLRFFDIQKTTFQVELHNALLGTVIGKGIIDDKTIGWEFRKDASMQGFETFHLDSKGGYRVHAEYASADEYRSLIHAYILPESSIS